MEDCLETKIWRYMDLAKFLSLMITESLYFVCPLCFDDPYEGVLPRRTVQGLEKVVQCINDSSLALINNESGKQLLKKFARELQSASRERKGVLSYGVNCWHKSEHQSEAMWRLYSASGRGIAIESTIGHLTVSLKDRQDLLVKSVQYVDFDKELPQLKLKDGLTESTLFLKRKSFEHEKELRAAIRLPKKENGILVKCNLDTLIDRIHISPFAPAYLKEVLESLCTSKLRRLGKDIIPSEMFNTPDYIIASKSIRRRKIAQGDPR